MKKLILVMFLMTSTNLFAAEDKGREITSDNVWKQAQNVIKQTIKKTKRSQEATFKKPKFALRDSIEPFPVNVNIEPFN